MMGRVAPFVHATRRCTLYAVRRREHTYTDVPVSVPSRFPPRALLARRPLCAECRAHCLTPDVALDSHADFYVDALRFGSLRCFRHFCCALRGREELVITVPSCDARRLLALHSPGCARRLRDVSQAAACSRRKLTQARARSSEAEVDEAQVGACFLLAAYSRYSACPYVWVRPLPAFHARRRSLR